MNVTANSDSTTENQQGTQDPPPEVPATPPPAEGSGDASEGDTGTTGAVGEPSDTDHASPTEELETVAAKPAARGLQTEGVGPLSIIQPGGACEPGTEFYLAAPGSPMAGFEIDGNLCLEGPLDDVQNQGGTDDWSTVSPTIVPDGYSDSTGWRRGASESSWPWTLEQTGGGVSNGDTDMGNVYEHSITDVNGDFYGFLGIERATTNGAVAYYIELNKLDNRFGPVPEREQGDLRMIVYQAGGSTPVDLAGIDSWSEADDDWESLTTDPSSFPGFIGGFNRDAGQSSINDSGIITNLDGETLTAGRFMEFGINLSLLFDTYGDATCKGGFSTLNIRSGQSPSGTSSISDYIAPLDVSVPSTCSSVDVEKSWNIDGQVFADGDQPFGNADLTLTGQTDAQFGTEYNTHSDGTTEYAADDVVTIGESVSDLPAGCTNVPTGDTGEHTLVSGRNLFEVTNTVTCTRLTLVKTVEGDADPTAWTLNAAGTTPISGVSGAPTVTDALVAPADYTITESGGPGDYQQTNLVCMNGATELTLTGGNVVTLAQGEKVTCTITNTALIGLQVTKTWIVNGTEYANESQPVGDATLTVDDVATDFGATTPDLLLGQEVTVAETVTDLPDLCTNAATIDGVAVTSATHTMTLTPAPNVVSIVNTVTCDQNLTLVKIVDNEEFGGTNVATDWTLSAAGFDGTVSGETGDTDVWPASVSTGDYTLSEDGPAGYSASDWTCTQVFNSGDDPESIDVTDGVTGIALGSNVTCEITNTALPGSVTWSKIAQGSGAALAGSTWSLTGPGVPADTVVVDCTLDPCTALPFDDENAAVANFLLSNLMWGEYTLTENTPPPGYALDTTAHVFEITGPVLDHTLGDVINVQLPGPELPLTGGIGRDQIYIIGVLILLLAITSYGVITLTRRRDPRSLT